MIKNIRWAYSPGRPEVTIQNIIYIALGESNHVFWIHLYICFYQCWLYPNLYLACHWNHYLSLHSVGMALGVRIGICRMSPLRSLLLTHWGRDKMDAISQTTLSNAFLRMKMLEFWLKFHWSLFLGVQLTIFNNWFGWWLGAVQTTSHYLNQWWLVYRRIYASLGLNDLIYIQLSQRWVACADT